MKPKTPQPLRRMTRYLDRLLVALLLMLSTAAWTQTVTQYTFTSGTEAWSQISGGAQLNATASSFDDQTYTINPVASVLFAGTYYDQVFVSANGFVTFTAAPAGTNYTPIETSSTAYTGAISAFGCDVANASSGTREIRWQEVGSEVVIQWLGARRDGQSESISFQIRINTATGVIKTVYNASTPSASTANYPQVGLRGASNTVYNNRAVDTSSPAAGWSWAVSRAGTSNSDECRYNNTINASQNRSPVNGQTFTWTPPCLPPTTSNAGPDQTVCGASATLAANAPSIGTGAWSIISGSGGAVTTPSSPTSNFTGVAGTTYTLRWTISNGVCTASTNDVVITLTANPTTATVGGTQTICTSGTSTSLGGNTPSIGTGAWSVVSGGTGTFSASTSGTSTFTHTGGAGPVVVRWTISNSPCTASTANVTINITPTTTASAAGPDQTICISSGSTALAANTPTQGTGAWSILAGSPNTSTAQLSSTSSPTATFTPTTSGTYNLRWTISNSPCAVSADDVAIIVRALPTTATVGGTQTICTSGTSTSLGGNTPGTGTGAWSVVSGGTGTFSASTSGTSTFTHTGGAGPVVVRWTISNSPCAASTADVTINITPTTTTSAAGPDQTICISSGSTALAANTPTQGTGAWSILAGSPNTSTAQLSSTGSPTATFTPTTPGTYNLRWTISNSPCAASAEDVAIIVRALPTTATVGGTQTICTSGTSTSLGGNTPGSGTGAWSVVSGGTGTFSASTSGTSTFTHTGGAGPVVVRWTISNSPCAASTADVTINITPTTTTSAAGPDQTICISAVSTALAANTPTQGTGAWSILAGSPNTSTAQLSSTASPTATLTPTASGTYTLRWTITNSPCPASTNDVVIVVRALPTTATVGGTQTICNAGTTTSLGGNTPSSGTGAWSVVSGGTGTFSNSASGTSTFTHTGGAGPVVVRWTISNSPCATSTADVTLNITPATTTANAGPDQTICLSNVSTTLAANTPTQGTGAWSILAGSPNTSTSQLSSTTSPTSTFTPTATGAYTLRWTISNSPCAASTNDVLVTVNPFAFAVSETFSSNSTFNVPAGVTQISVQAWGGGASGGGSTNAGTGFGAARGGAGGGGGAYVTEVLTVTPGSTLNIAVGASVNGTSGASGSNGNPSTIVGFESLVLAAGGSSGAGNTAGGTPAGGAGGTAAASQGDTKTSGSNGSNGASGFGASSGNGGAGANSGGAGGPGLGAFDGSSDGDAGTAPGGGGGGGRTANNGGTRAGGSGGAGRVIITYTPVATVSASLTTICAGGSSTLTASGGNTYLWSPGGATTPSISVSPGTTTTYSVTVTNTCPAYLTQQVTVVPTPNAGSNNTLTICSNDAPANMGTLLGTHDAGTWSGPNTVTADTYNPATMGPGNYVYTVTAAPCPNATATIAVTENTATPRYLDFDGDGFGDPSNSVLSCVAIGGRVSNNSDCDDTQNLYADGDGDGFGAGSPVACGVADNSDCNDAQLNYADSDGDGFGAGSTIACGGVTNNSDCNNAQLNYADSDGDGFGAGSPIACGGVTNNADCNDAQLNYADGDNDGFGAGSPIACGGVTNNSDCNDAQLNYADGDNDGFGAGSPIACGGVTNNTDCNDAQLQYADGDGDGFGAGSPVACGVVSNNDCNDAQFQYADTDGDGLGAGAPVACGVASNTDDCPTVVGIQGDACDADPSPFNFLLGTINGSCMCAVAPCTENLTLDLRPDNSNSAQIGWDIRNDNSNLVIMSGGFVTPGGAYPNGVGALPIDFCLPQGCYRLRVYDSAGDGFVSGGTTGGYQLREFGTNGRRIIDNTNNFTDLPGGAPDISAIAPVYDNGAFCLPLGTNKPIFQHCDKLDWSNNGTTYLVATEDPLVSASWNPTTPPSDKGYEFWFFDPNGTYSFRRFRHHAASDGHSPANALRACHVRINGWSNTPTSPHLVLGKVYNVRIRSRYGVNNYTPFGPACLFKIDPSAAQCPLVKLQDNPANLTDYSCGVTRYFGGGANPGINMNSSLPGSAANWGNKIVATPPQPIPAVPSANVRYQFRFINEGEYPAAGSCIIRPPQANPTIYLNWATGDKLKCGVTYSVDVRVSLDNGATWCVGGNTSTPSTSQNPRTYWGPVCTVAIRMNNNAPCPQESLSGGGSNLALVNGDGNLTMYPNPNRGDQLFISLSEVATDVNTVSVDIYDMTGKKVTTRTIAMQDGYLKTALDLNGDLKGGLYLVNVTAGEKTWTERLVIQQ